MFSVCPLAHVCCVNQSVASRLSYRIKISNSAHWNNIHHKNRFVAVQSRMQIYNFYINIRVSDIGFCCSEYEICRSAETSDFIK
jgi:hypothetical protein